MIFYLPLIILILLIFKGDIEEIHKIYVAIPNDIKMIILFAFVPVIVVHYLVNYVLKCNKKAQYMLLEQMSDEDFDLLLTFTSN